MYIYCRLNLINSLYKYKYNSFKVYLIKNYELKSCKKTLKICCKTIIYNSFYLKKYIYSATGYLSKFLFYQIASLFTYSKKSNSR